MWLVPTSARRLKTLNQTSTWLSQLAWIGVKWKWTFLWRASQLSCLRLWVLKLSMTTDLGLRIEMGGQDLVHEVEEPAPPARVVTRLDLSARLTGDLIDAVEADVPCCLNPWAKPVKARPSGIRSAIAR